MFLNVEDRLGGLCEYYGGIWAKYLDLVLPHLPSRISLCEEKFISSSKS